jgi:hypothetical protein
MRQKCRKQDCRAGGKPIAAIFRGWVGIGRRCGVLTMMRITGAIAGLAALLHVATTGPVLAGPTRSPDQMEADCWHQFMDSDSKEIACAFPTIMDPADRESIAKLTRQVFKDARCEVAIRIERALVDAAVTTPDTTFVAPPQPVTCEVVTSRGTLPIAFTFAPKIEIKAGKATKASPGMGDVTGINSWLAWPVVAYVNRAGSIQDVMLRVVNAFLERKRGQAAAP